MKRTKIDFSKHELIIDESEKISSFWLKKPNSLIYNVKFIFIDGLTVVTGDFGNFLFNNVFYPSKDNFVSDEYWVEKLRLNSTQQGIEYSPEKTKELLEYEIKEGLEAYGYEGEELREITNFYKQALKYVESEEECKKFIFGNDKPFFIDYEELPICYEPLNKLKIIFDSFEEICSRIK